MKLTHGLILVITALISITAQAGNVCVAVQDPSGAAAPGIALEMAPLSASAVRRGVTDGQGLWCGEAGPGAYVVRARGKGMESGSATVVVERGAREQRVEIGLQIEAVASQVEVTASRMPESLLEAPLPVRQIDSAQLVKLGARQLNDAMQEQPEVVTFAGGSHSGGASMNLQGFTSRDVELLIDGQPLTGRLSGYVDLNQFDSSVVEAVEIKTGASAMTYGLQGMGGAINLVTRRAGAGGHGNFESGYGSFNTGLMRLDGGFAKGDFALYAAGALQRSLGYDLDPTTGPKTQSSSRVRNLFTSIYLPRWKNWAAGLTALHTDQDFWGFEGTTAADTYDSSRPKRRLALMPRASLTLGANSLLNLRARRLYYRSDEDLVYRTPLSFRAQKTENEANGGDVEYTMARPGGLRLSTGLFFNHLTMTGERLTSPGSHAETDVWSQVSAVELPLPGRLRVLAGYRADHDTSFGGRFSPQAALAWRATERVSASVSATRGMRAPDFNERFLLMTHAGGRVRILGDPNLRPQQSWSYTASVMGRLNRKLRLESRAFHNDLTDLIQTTFLGMQGVAATYQYGNVGEARIRGLGGSIAYTHSRRLELVAGYQYMDTLNKGASTLLEYAPRHRGNFRATWSDARRGLLLSFFGNATAATYLGVTSGQRVYMDGFELMGLNAQKDLTRRVALRMTLRNLTDNVNPAYRLTAPFGAEASVRIKLGRVE